MLKVQHECEIHVNPDEVLFIPGRGPLRTTLGILRRLCMVSRTNPSAKKYLRSEASIVYEKRRHLRHYKYVIHPFSLFRHWWELAMIVTMFTIYFILPYQASFDMYRVAYGSTVMKNVFIGVFIVDIIINFRTGFYDENSRIVQLEPHLIARKYVFHDVFIFDLLGSIPTDIFFIPYWDTLIVSRQLFSLIMIFKGVSLWFYTMRLADTFDISVGTANILNFIVVMGFIFHWQACIHFIMPIAATSMGIPALPHSQSWISRLGIWNETTQVQYRTSLYRAIAIFTRSGYDESPPWTLEDQYLAVLCQVFAFFIVCTMIGALMHIFKGMNSSRLKFEAMTVELKQYMRHKQLPLESQERFVSYYEFRYQNNYFRESEIVNTVSAQISQEIAMHSCRKLVENVTFFNNLPMSLLVRIVALLRSQIFLTNDVIVRANQPGDCMYFIASGTVAIYTKSGKEVCHLEDGAHFGEIALVMPDERRVASVVAVEICELYRLERADFARTIHPYPMLWERIKNIAMERHEKTRILNAQ